MRISESKYFSWHGLCLLLQGITRSLGGRDMQRVEVATGQARMASGSSSDQHNRRALRAATSRARAARRTSPSHLPKPSGTSRPGKREKFPPCRASRSWDFPLVRMESEEEKLLLSLSSAIWPTAGEGSAWRPGCSLQACIPAKLAINLCCWHANQVLLWCLYLFRLCVPALDPAFAFSHTVPAGKWHQRVCRERTLHAKMSISLFSDGGGLKRRICSPFPLPCKDLFVLCLSFVRALPFLSLNRVCFFRIFFLWKQYLCAFLQSQMDVFRNSMKVCEERIYL